MDECLKWTDHSKSLWWLLGMVCVLLRQNSRMSLVFQRNIFASFYSPGLWLAISSFLLTLDRYLISWSFTISAGTIYLPSLGLSVVVWVCSWFFVGFFFYSLCIRFFWYVVDGVSSTSLLPELSSVNFSFWKNCLESFVVVVLWLPAVCACITVVGYFHPLNFVFLVRVVQAYHNLDNNQFNRLGYPFCFLFVLFLFLFFPFFFLFACFLLVFFLSVIFSCFSFSLSVSFLFSSLSFSIIFES